MKFCPVVPEICHGQVHGSRKERRRIRIIIIKIIRRNGAKTVSLQKLFGDLIMYQVHLASAGFELVTLVAIGTDCTGSCKSNYHTITTTMAPICFFGP